MDRLTRTSGTMSHPISYQGRTVWLVSPEHIIHPGCGKMGKIVHEIALSNTKAGTNTNIIIPYSEKLADVKWDVSTRNYTHNFCFRKVDNISIFAVGRDQPWSEVVPAQDKYYEYVQFADALNYFIHLHAFTQDPAAIMHFFDYPMGFAMSNLKSTLRYNANNSDLMNNIIFSPMDPLNFNKRYNTGDLYNIDGLESGANAAHKVMFWSEKFYDDIKRSNRFPEFLSAASGKEDIMPGGWQPRMTETIPQVTIRGMRAGYMDTLYKSGLDRSFHFMARPGVKMDKVFYFIPEPSDTGKPSRKSVIRKSLRRVENEMDSIVKNGIDGIKMLGGGRDNVFYDYWGNLGGLVAFLEQMMIENTTKTEDEIKNARYLFMADAGDFKRGGGIAQAKGVEALKSMTPEGDRTLGINCILQAPVFFRQLPDDGKGWIVYTASDNKWIPDGTPRTGNNYLWESNAKIIISGRPAANVEAVRGLGCWITDKFGQVIFFAEKASPEVIRHTLNKLGLKEEDLCLNTFVWAMKYDLAKKIVDLYKNKKCKKIMKGKQEAKCFVTTYPMDISTHFIFPTTLTRAEWEKTYEILQYVRAKKDTSKFSNEFTGRGLSLVEVAKQMKGFEKEGPGTDQVFNDLDDWMTIYDMASIINEDANGIDGANIGKNCLWNDFGDLKSMVNEMYFENFSDNEWARKAERTRSGYPLDKNTQNVDMNEIRDYVKFIDPESGKPMQLAEGEIPEKVILNNVSFDHPVEIVADRVILDDVKLGKGVTKIPANTIIAKGEIEDLEEAPDQSETLSKMPALIFNCHKKGKVLVYRGMAHASLSLEYVDQKDLNEQGLSPSDTPLTLTPILFNLKAPINEQDDYILYPGINLLEPEFSMLEQSFIIEDENGKPKLLGLTFFQVKGD